MYRVESLKLFGDISKVSDKYKSWHLKDDENEIKDNRKLKTLLNYHNSRFDHIKEKYDSALNVSNKIVGISIATRPDCITKDIAKLIASSSPEITV